MRVIPEKIGQKARLLAGRVLRPVRQPPLPTSGPVWVHVGCGECNDPRFVNVDMRGFGHVHVISRGIDLKEFPDEFADMVYGCHVLEHISFRETVRVLRGWRRVLRPGGVARLSVPDFDKIVDRYLASGRDLLTVIRPLMGGQTYPGNFHCAVFNWSSLQGAMVEAGFRDPQEWFPSQEVGWVKDWSWETWISLNVEAKK